MKTPLPIYALALTSFALGTAEFAPNGQLLSASRDLVVSVADAGLITTGFALGATIGGPIIAAATLRVPHKLLVLVLATVFLASNVVTALAPSLSLAVGSRAIAGAMLGAFLGVAVTIASDLVPVARRGGAIALVFLGFTVANVLGVVIGNLAGAVWGWRSVFWLVTVLSVVAVVGLAAALPRRSQQPPTSALAGLAALRNGRLWLTYLAIALGYGGLFVMFTFIAPLLEERTAVAPDNVVWLLLVFGVGLVVGTYVAGRGADRSIAITTITALAVLILSLAAFALLSDSLAAVIVLLLLVGGAGFGLVPPLQSLVLEIARVTSPLISALAAASFNAGVAIGSALGGEIIRRDAGFDALALAGAGLSALGLAVFLVVTALQRRERAEEPTPERRDVMA
jgi:DHA1 family inner membrane transport protein